MSPAIRFLPNLFYITSLHYLLRFFVVDNCIDIYFFVRVEGRLYRLCLNYFLYNLLSLNLFICCLQVFSLLVFSITNYICDFPSLQASTVLTHNVFRCHRLSFIDIFFFYISVFLKVLAVSQSRRW